MSASPQAVGNKTAKAKPPDKARNNYFQADAAARTLLPKLKAHITANKGKFRRGSDGRVYLVMNERKISLQPDRNDDGQLGLLMDACGVTIRGSLAAQAAIDMLAYEGGKTAERLNFRSFAALSRKRDRVYVNVGDKKLLKVTENDAGLVQNGENEDSIWVDHPSITGDYEDADGPYRSYTPNANHHNGAALFERLLVTAQSTVDKSLSWLTAMDEGIFPFIDEDCERRLGVTHIGDSQSGKSTAAERFHRLHGLGKLKIDWTAAAIDNSPDQGLLVLDNLERRNITPQLIDAIIRRTTGGVRGRSSNDGKQRRLNSARETLVITTIEGLPTDELKERTINVNFFIPEGGQVDNSKNEFVEIIDQRDAIFSSVIVPVIQLWLKGRKNPRRKFWKSNNGRGPKPNFGDHMNTLAELLVCFGQVYGKPDEWAFEIIDGWERALNEAKDAHEDEHNWEYAIFDILEKAQEEDSQIICYDPRPYKGGVAKLYVTRSAVLRSKLAERRDAPDDLPDEPAVFGRRLHTAKFSQRLVFVRQGNPDFPEMAKETGHNKIGFLVPQKK